MKKRSVAAVIILSIVTCGIYSLYWLCVTTDEIEAMLGPKSDGACRSGGVAVLLTILTCGIYAFYWYYKEAKRIEVLCEDVGIRPANEFWLYLIFCLLGLEIVSMAIMQDELNRVNDATGKIA